MGERQQFLRNLKEDSFSQDCILKLYQLINFKSWKREQVKISDLDDKSIKLIVNEYYTEQSMTKSILVQTIKKAIKMIPEIKSIILVNSEHSFYTEFLIFGCNSSSDIDVGCIVRKCDHLNGMTKPLADSEILRLQSDLTTLGYDITRGVDISEIFIDSFGNVTAVSKGTKEIQNMIYATHHLHAQKYPCPIKSMIDVEPFDKIRGLSKFFLDNLNELANPLVYSKKEISAIKKEIYFGGSVKIIEFAKEIKKYVDFSILGYDIENHNLMSILKSVVMKYIQTILLIEGECSYLKADLATKISKYIPDSAEHALYFLFRGRKGIFNDGFILQLHNRFVKIIDETAFIPIITSIDIGSITNPTDLTDDIFDQFIKSPIHPTTEFEKVWSDTYSDNGLNSLFVSQVSDSNDLFGITNAKDEYIIRPEDRDRFLFVNPKSIEWMNLLSIYRCGTNSKNILDSIESKYNLIRGNIGEIIVVEYLDLELLGLSHMKKITIGMIVQNIVPGSRACCPDLILASDNEIIPVEIKCLKNLVKNRDYYRGISLAKRQCVSAIELFGPKYSYLINRYLIIIVGWNELKIEHIFFNIY